MEFVQTKPAPERGAGIKPGVERSGTPGTSRFNQTSPGTGRRNKARAEAKRRELHGVRSKTTNPGTAAGIKPGWSAK